MGKCEFRFLIHSMLKSEEADAVDYQTPQFPMYENTVKKYHEAIDKGLSYKYAVQGVLYDDLCQARSMQFMRYVIVWMLRIVSPTHDYPTKQVQYVIRLSL